ncbi:MAG TPA: permease [Clostridiales bacterium]|nr:permease [Clostridiales bacterium]
MSKVIQFSRRNKLLILVALSYILLSIFMPDKAVQSLKNSLYYIKEMLMIMPVILLLTALITAWVPKKAIEKNLGKDSGIKGSIFSFLLGSFSAGPIYAAFPVCKALLSKGASISNIVILLSTWAVIKVPMLLNEAKFLGPKFMIVRWILTTIAIFIMGYVTSKLVKKEDLPLDDIKENSSVDTLNISSEYCIGCGLCAKIAPEYFKVENKKAKVIKQCIKQDIKQDIKQGEMKIVNEAIEKCPSKAINQNKQVNF